MLERANYAFKATAPARFWPAVPRFAAAAGSEVGGEQKGCKKFRCRWRWVRLPQGGAGVAVQPVRAHRAAGAFAHRAGAVVDRAAECGLLARSGCQRDAINMRRKKQPACPAQS